MEQLSSHLAANLAELNARFGRSADFYAKELELYHCKGAIVLFDGMASLKGLWQLLLDAASRRTPPGPAKHCCLSTPHCPQSLPLWRTGIP